MRASWRSGLSHAEGEIVALGYSRRLSRVAASSFSGLQFGEALSALNDPCEGRGEWCGNRFAYIAVNLFLRIGQYRV